MSASIAPRAGGGRRPRKSLTLAGELRRITRNAQREAERRRADEEYLRVHHSLMVAATNGRQSLALEELHESNWARLGREGLTVVNTKDDKFLITWS